MYLRRTGEVFMGEGSPPSIKSLVDRDQRGETIRILSSIQEAMQLTSWIAGVKIPPSLAETLGFNRLINWEIITDPKNSNVLIIGNNEEDSSSFSIADSLATVAIIRGEPMTHRKGTYEEEGKPIERRVEMEAVRMAGVTDLGGSYRIVEVSYGYDNFRRPSDEYVPSELELDHVGFTVRRAEYPESDRGNFFGHKYHMGPDVKAKKKPEEEQPQTLYQPHYLTSQIKPTQVNYTYDQVAHRGGRFHGSVITEAMADVTSGRMIRTEYDNFWCVAAGRPEHRVFLGEPDDIAQKAGLYTEINGNTLSIGLSSSRRTLRRTKAFPDWSMDIPLTVKS